MPLFTYNFSKATIGRVDHPRCHSRTEPRDPSPPRWLEGQAADSRPQPGAMPTRWPVTDDVGSLRISRVHVDWWRRSMERPRGSRVRLRPNVWLGMCQSMDYVIGFRNRNIVIPVTRPAGAQAARSGTTKRAGQPRQRGVRSDARRLSRRAHRFVRRPSGESKRPLWRSLRLTPAFCRFAAFRVDFRDGRSAAAPVSSW